MLPDRKAQIHIELEEIAPGEFEIFVLAQDRKIASLYLKGDRQYALNLLELARQRVLLTAAGEDAGDLGENISLELVRLSANDS